MNSEKIIWSGPSIEELNQALQQMNEIQEDTTAEQEAEFVDLTTVSDYGIVPVSTSITYAQYMSKSTPQTSPVSRVSLVANNGVGSSSISTNLDNSIITPPVNVTQTTVLDPSNPSTKPQYNLEVPNNIKILNELTTRKIDSSGNLYVYITVEFDDIPGVSDYQIRLARA